MAGLGAMCSFVDVVPRERRALRVGRGGGLKELSRNGKWRGVGRGMGKGGLMDDGFGEGDEALKATIEKSKKALDMQKNLIREIVERRKLVSAIKDTIEEGIDAVDGSLHKFDLTLSSKQDTLYSYDASFLPRTTAPETPAINSNGTAGFKDEIFVQNLQAESSIAHSLGLAREVNEAAAEAMIMPVVLPEVSEPDTLGKQLEQLAEIYTKEEDGQHVIFEEGTSKPPPLAGENVMNVILVSAECAPWSKTGGLGDVAGTLPKALARRGHRVMVVAPRYGNYAEAQSVGVRKIYNVDGQDMEATYHHAYIDGVDFVFIDSAIFRNWDNNIYGGGREDILKRMVMLCKAAAEVPWHVPCGGICYGDGNLVFIANDWHTALLPVYLKAYYRDNGLMNYTRCVLVIHNIAHQGRGPVNDFRYLGLPAHYLELFKFYDPVGGEHCNIFAAGIKAADRVVTVSRGYAWELKTSEGGWGLHDVIKENDWKFQGIVNGIDTYDWNPELDVFLKSDGYINYNSETLLAGKPKCKAALQRELGLPCCDGTPLVGFIGRLDYQKGIDLIEKAIPWMAGQDMQLVMLGTGRTDLEEILKSFESQYSGKIRAWIGFSVKMAHRITAGADILLMPSRFEPCGLNQLHAMMYGTIPVVHAVGGLRDTVKPFDPFNNAGQGWTFDRAEANKLIDAMGNCLNTYRSHKDSWEGLQRRGMAQDLSWDNAAQLYEEVLVAAKYQW